MTVQRRGRRQGSAGVRRARRVALLVALAAAVVLGGADPVGAVAPDRQGWWTRANPGDLVPVLSGSVGIPPDVPPDGLLVQGPSAEPQAVAALDYAVPEGYAAGPLTLTVAPDGQTTPNSALQACPLTKPGFSSAAGGPMADAPAWDCSRAAPGTPDPSGSSFVFAAGGLVRDGRLSIAILPAGVADRVVFNRPGPGSLSLIGLGQGGGGETRPQPGTEPALTSTEAFGPDPTSLGAAPLSDAQPSLFEPPGAAPASPEALAPPVVDATDAPPAFTVTRGPRTTTRTKGSMIVGCLLAVVSALSGWSKSRRALLELPQPG